MTVSQFAWRSVSALAVFSISTIVSAQNYVLPQGSEFSLLGQIVGDQVNPSLALSPSVGYVTWEDNGIDRSGAGVGACRLQGGSFIHQGIIRVDAGGYSDQSRPQVALLQNGTALYAWESRATGNADIYIRLMKTNGVFATRDTRVNTYLKDAQRTPAVAALLDGSAVVTWASAGQDGSLAGVFARKVGPTGVLSPAHEFQVNQFTPYNQRSPAVAALANGNFVIAWISEQQRYSTPNSSSLSEMNARVDVYARIFHPDGTPETAEIPINLGTNICANPAVAGLSDGGFTVVWSERNKVVKTNGWDIMGCAFNSSGLSVSNDFKINTFVYGDQYRPKIAAGPSGCLVVWTSLGQDGAREGVFGRYLTGGNEPAGNEFQVNTTAVSQQIHPIVAWNGSNRFLVVWSSLIADFGFDLFGQAYAVNPTP